MSVSFVTSQRKKTQGRPPSSLNGWYEIFATKSVILRVFRILSRLIFFFAFLHFPHFRVSAQHAIVESPNSERHYNRKTSPPVSSSSFIVVPPPGGGYLSSLELPLLPNSKVGIGWGTLTLATKGTEREAGIRGAGGGRGGGDEAQFNSHRF